MGLAEADEPLMAEIEPHLRSAQLAERFAGDWESFFSTMTSRFTVKRCSFRVFFSAVDEEQQQTVEDRVHK